MSEPRRFASRLTPPRLFVGSFAGLILFGTAGLLVLPGLYTGARMGALDALFTATSAVCVTGLIVADTATVFTPLGQAFLLLLIQLGGLGMLTFTTLIILSLGRRLSLTQEAVSADAAHILPDVNLRHLARTIVTFTFVIELFGAAILFAMWVDRFGPLPALGHAVFQAVSAFCNAGFSTFSDSLVGFRTSPVTLSVMMALIVVGGIGFITVEELRRARRSRRAGRSVRLSLHTRIVLATSAILLLGGWLVYGAWEWRGTLAPLPVSARIMNALFMSVTARTAGFNTIDHAQADDASNFLTVILMSAGGSPGSTAGGLKTTTVALIALLAWSRLRGRRTVMVSGRSIPEETVQRAVGLFVFASAIVSAAILLISFTDAGLVPGASGTFLARMFEVVSAFNTVGLSMGMTPNLSEAGRWIVILLMFVGRVGPLSFAAAVALSPTRKPEFRYAYETVVVG